jgi:hypothetical protein
MKKIVNCEFCTILFKQRHTNQKYCKLKCWGYKRRKVLNRPSPEEIERLIMETNQAKTAANFNVSVTTLKKWLVK